MKNENTTNQKSSGIGGILGGVLLIYIVFSMVFGCSDSSATDSSTDYKIESCSSRTNTYQKCHWSAWENRCVCKFR